MRKAGNMLYNDLLTTLQKLTHRENISQSEIADVLNVQVGTLNKRINRGTYDFKDSEIKQIEAHYGVDILKRQYLDNMLDNYNKASNNNFEIDYIAVDYYKDVFGSCGSGTFVFSEDKSIINVPKDCISYFSNNKKYSVINARGDSMQPYIIDGDKLVIEHYNGAQIVDNSIYVFRYEDNIFIKRLIHNIDQIIIKSDNKEYATRCIERNDLQNFQVIGQVVGLLRKC